MIKQLLRHDNSFRILNEMKDYKNLINKLNNKDNADDTASVDSQNLNATMHSFYKEDHKDAINIVDNKKINKKNIPKIN